MLITFGMKESSYLCSQIISVENAVPLHAKIPRTSGRDFDLPSEDALQEYLKFPYKFFFQFYFCSRVIVANFVLQITPEEKIARIKIR
jgi:hypothetical protein